MYQSPKRRSRYNRATLRRSRALALWSCCAVLATGLGCAGKARPADRIEAVRALYRAEVTGFIVESPALPSPSPAPAAETVPSPSADEGSGLVAPATPVSDIRLDLRLAHTPGDELSGLTLEVGLLDATGAEKEHYRIWVDAAGLGGGDKRVSYRLEDVPYQEGDRFVASVRTPVPAAERSLYKEFPVAP